MSTYKRVTVKSKPVHSLIEDYNMTFKTDFYSLIKTFLKLF